MDIKQKPDSKTAKDLEYNIWCFYFTKSSYISKWYKGMLSAKYLAQEVLEMEGFKEHNTIWTI